MTVRTLRLNQARRLPERRNQDGIALVSVLVLMLIITTLSVLVLGLVLSQVRPTLFTNKNTRTVSAAQAGIDAAISQIRNSTTTDESGNIVGDIHGLPCVVNGTVDGTANGTAFASTISYFKEDPTNRSADWRETNALPCYQNTNPNGLRAVPHYAIVTSTGADESAKVMSDVADRTLEATYTFPLTTRTISGDQILDTNQQFCAVANSATIGSNITFQPANETLCRTGDPLSIWSWRSDYMIHLSSTDIDGHVPLCLSGRASNSTPVAMTLQPCSLLSTDALGQRFSWTGDHTWKGQNAGNTDYGTSYIVNASSTVKKGDKLSVSTSAGNVKPVPLPAVGKGNASYTTNEVVNQSLFGRCLDVTDVDITKAFMITYPCKQDPTGKGRFDWNHKWYYTEPDPNVGEKSVKTTIHVVDGSGTKNCLIATNTQGIVAGAGASAGSNKPYIFPRFRTSSNKVDCSSANTIWTRNGETGDPLTSWTIVDNYGRCLSAIGPSLLADKNWKSVIVSECDGKDYQKWNVPDDPIEANIGDYSELAGRTE